MKLAQAVASPDAKDRMHPQCKIKFPRCRLFSHLFCVLSGVRIATSLRRGFYSEFLSPAGTDQPKITCTAVFREDQLRRVSTARQKFWIYRAATALKGGERHGMRPW